MKVWKSLKNKNKTSVDCSGLSVKFLSIVMLIPNMSECIFNLLNNIIEENTVTIQLKVSTVIPLIKNKKKDPSDLNNMRSIFLIPTLAKILDRILYNQLLCHLNAKKYFSDNQFGFRARHGTEHLALTDIACA